MYIINYKGNLKNIKLRLIIQLFFKKLMFRKKEQKQKQKLKCFFNDFFFL
jgi:hypothetical protein